MFWCGFWKWFTLQPRHFNFVGFSTSVALTTIQVHVRSLTKFSSLREAQTLEQDGFSSIIHCAQAWNKYTCQKSSETENFNSLLSRVNSEKKNRIQQEHKISHVLFFLWPGIKTVELIFHKVSSMQTRLSSPRSLDYWYDLFTLKLNQIFVRCIS